MRYDDSQELGSKAELLFIEQAKKRYKYINHSTATEDMQDHWDICIEFEGEKKKVDVKSMKRISRHGEWLKDEMWVELKNVKGNPGWVFGKADYIAQSFPSGFLLIDRELLVDLLNIKLEQIHVDKPEDALYKLYTRSSREDLLTRIKFSDLPSKPIIWQTI